MRNNFFSGHNNKQRGHTKNQHILKHKKEPYKNTEKKIEKNTMNHKRKSMNV